MATINDEASLYLRVNGEDAKKEFARVKETVEDLKKKLVEAGKAGDFRQVEELRKQLRPAVKQMDSMLLNIGRIDAAMKNLSLQTPKELRRTMQLINAEMNSGAIEVGSKEWKEHEEQLKKVKARYKELMDAQKEVKQSSMSFKDMLDIGGNVSMIMTTALQMKDNLADFMRENVNSYIALDAEMANVQKYTGLTREQIELLNRELDKLDTRTSKIKLNQLVEEGGRGGLRSIEELVQYAKAADIINVALDELGEGATETIFKLSTIFGDKDKLGVEGSMMAVGSVVNDLSQNMVAQAPYITEYINRLAGVGAMAEMTIPQIAAYGAVLNANGQNVEKSATATSRLLNKMFQEPAKIAQVAGLEISNFTQLVKTDINAAFIMLLEHLNSLGKMDVLAPIFKEMNIEGDGATATLTTLAKNIELVKQKQQEAQAAYEDAISVIKESNVQNTTEEAKLEKKRKKLEEVKVALGEKLLPIMGSFTSTGTMIIKTINALLDVFNDYKVTIISTGSAILLYTGYLKAKNLWTEKEITLEKIKILLQEKSLVVLKKIGTFMKTNPWGIAIVAITAIIGLFIDYNRRLGRVTEGEKALNKVRNDAKQKVVEEENRLKALVKVASDETQSLENRKKAIDALNQIIPGYNAQLNATTGEYKANKKALDDYLTSLTKKYEIEGAKDMLGEIGKSKSENEIKKKELEQEIEELRKRRDNIEKAATSTQANGAAGMTMGQHSSAVLSQTIARKKSELSEINDALDEIKEKETTILGIYGNDIALKDADEIVNTNPNSNGVPSSVPGDQSNAVKEWREKEEAINKMAYYTGQQTYEEYCTKKNEILIEYYDKLLADTSLKESERLKIEAERAEELHKQQTAADKATLDEKLKALEQQKKEEEDAIVNAYISRDKIEKADEQRLREQLFQINQDYLNKKKGLYVEYGKNEEAAKIEENLEKQSLDEKLRKHKEYIRLLDSMRRQYDKQSIEEREAAELLTIDALYQQKLISEEEYQQKKIAIEEKYKGEERKEAYEVSDGGGWGDKTKEMYFSISDLIDSVTEKGKLSFEDIGKAAESAWAVAGSALQIYSNYAQAEADLEVARIEKKYDQQIKAAGKNDKKVKQLEEQRDREIAKVKSKANKKAMKIEIAQALAQTAMAAINAYSSASKVHWLLGPVAAAMAVAAGMMQIATIRKQHQVQEAGYYSGGFTRKSLNNHEVVGVVHANEFVANASATANPALAPFFSLLDYAQRNNTIGSLTPEDVSHALGTGAVVQATKTTAQESRQNSGELLAVAGSLTGNNEVIKRLNEKLDEGIDAFVILDGERGFEQKYSQYLKMKNNSER